MRRWGYLATLAGVALIALFASGCTMTILMAPLNGVGAAIPFTVQRGSAGGWVRGTLPDGQAVAGRWAIVRSDSVLGLTQIVTPRGPITAGSLVGAGNASGVATLHGQGVTILCVFESSHWNQHGTAACADSRGDRYVGTF